MCTGIVSVLLNALANYVLIFGKLGFPALGVEGAAIATVVSAAAGPILLLGISLWRGNMLRAPLREMFSFNAAFAGRYFRRALPVLLNESLWSMGVLGYNAVFGRMGADNYAALTIFRTIENLGFVFFIGLCSACAVIVGKRVGEGRIDDAKRVSAAFLVLEPVLGLCVGLLIFLFAGAILSLFNSEPTSTAPRRSCCISTPPTSCCATSPISRSAASSGPAATRRPASSTTRSASTASRCRW